MPGRAEIWSRSSPNAIRHFSRDGKTLNWSQVEVLPQVDLPPDYDKQGYDCAGVRRFSLRLISATSK
jgi:hypothetical protein